MTASTSSATERPFFFDRTGARLFGLRHTPPAPGEIGFVMSHPFAEEKLWGHRVYVSFARQLAARGFPVLRFDYMGAGDSTGKTADTSLDTHLADLAAAVVEMRRAHPNVRHVGIVGLRFGASLAALLAERAVDDPALAAVRDAPLILWDPVLDGDGYFQELLRSNLSTQLAVYGKVIETREALMERVRQGGIVNVDGYELGKALFDSCARPALMDTAPKKHRGRVLVMQIAANDKVKERDDLRALAGAYGAGAYARAFEQPFWREIKPFYGRAENLQQETLAWLEKTND
jgi:pimeloyl-ACP methyl ester carboxylesterase